MLIFGRRLRSGGPKEVHSWCQKTLGSPNPSPREEEGVGEESASEREMGGLVRGGEGEHTAL